MNSMNCRFLLKGWKSWYKVTFEEMMPKVVFTVHRSGTVVTVKKKNCREASIYGIMLEVLYFRIGSLCSFLWDGCFIE